MMFTNIELVGIALEDLKSNGFHHHNNWKIILNITGEDTAIVDNKEYEFFPGTIMCIPPRVVHTKYSADHFRRCFKASTGETPVSYLMNLRIEYAKRLLVPKNATLITISEIALNSGFYDSRYFSRIFKKQPDLLLIIMLTNNNPFNLFPNFCL